MGSHDALSDEILELVLLRLDSPICLHRAASTCKRWRRIIASAAFRALHTSPRVVAGSYYNPGFFDIRRRFEPSPSAAAVDSRHFSLDFLPGDDTSNWSIKDSRGSLLLLDREDWKTGRHLIVCDPLTRRHVVIPPLTPSARCWGDTAVLLDGDSEGGGIGMSKFRVFCLVHDNRIHACMFTSGGSSFHMIMSLRHPH